MQGIYPILWANFLNFKKQYRAFFISGLIKPIFYLMIFNLGIGRRVNLAGGIDYLHFMIPGLITMIVVNHSFSNLVNWFTLRRNHFKVLDFYLVSPNSVWSVIGGNVLYGVCLSLLGFFLLWLVLILGSVSVKINLAVLGVIISLSIIFGALAIFVACLAKAERDSSVVSNLIITPLTFLCGTFFPLERLPEFLQYFAWCTPVTPGVYALRALTLGYPLSGAVIGLILFWTLFSVFLAGYFLQHKEM